VLLLYELELELLRVLLLEELLRALLVLELRLELEEE